MALTTAERNKRKRERKKRERAEAQKLQQQQLEEAAKKSQKDDDDLQEVEIEYVAEPPPENNNSSSNNNQGGVDDDQDLQAVMRRFQDRAALVYVTDGEDANNNNDTSEIGTSDNKSAKETDNLLNDEENATLSKTKLKAMFRPTVAQLKQRSLNPELVEAHDITAPDPDFLIYLKGIPGTVPVPRHWGRKRKYLQGKRGIEKPPFALPDFIVKTGICDVRDATAEDDAKMSVKQKNRMRFLYI